MTENNASLPPTEQEPLAEPLTERFDPLISTTRLVVGGVEVGLEEFVARLREWESISAERRATAQAPQAGRPQLPPGRAPAEPAGLPAEGDVDLLRYALIGFIFEAQQQAATGFGLAGRIAQLTGRVVSPVVRPVVNSRLARPVKRRFERLVDRGESQVDRWARLGRDEEVRSRALAELAFHDTVDDYIGYLAENPEVQELVQTQSTGLATELIEEVRERTVSADTFLEGVVRSLLRRAPRVSLPEPPEAVRKSAVSLRKTHKGTNDGPPKPPRPHDD